MTKKSNHCHELWVSILFENAPRVPCCWDRKCGTVLKCNHFASLKAWAEATTSTATPRSCATVVEGITPSRVRMHLPPTLLQRVFSSFLSITSSATLSVSHVKHAFGSARTGECDEPLMQSTMWPVFHFCGCPGSTEERFFLFSRCPSLKQCFVQTSSAAYRGSILICFFLFLMYTFFVHEMNWKVVHL